MTWALALTCLASLPAVAPAREAPELGEAFGPLVLPAVDGSGPVDLALFRGRKVLLIEFASW
jgi:hypothetical protein